MFTFKPDKPIYLQIYEDIVKEIITGKIKANTKLQSIRDLALHYSVNPNTIARVITELEKEQVVIIKRGVGSIVCSEDKVNELKSNHIKHYMNGFLNHMEEYGLGKEYIMSMLKKGIDYEDN